MPILERMLPNFSRESTVHKYTRNGLFVFLAEDATWQALYSFFPGFSHVNFFVDQCPEGKTHFHTDS